MEENNKALLEKVSQEHLMEFTRNISKEVRTSGSAEEWRAFQYAEERLRHFGFETNLYKRHGYISVPVSAELEINHLEFPSITHSMAGSTPQSGIHTDLVDVGDGTEDEFQAKDTRGKAVLINGLATPGAVEAAERYGAAGAIFINAEYTHEMIVSTVWGNPTVDQAENYPEISVLSVNYADGQKIRELLEKEQSAVCTLKTKVETTWCEIPTLIADYKGTVEPEKYILFSGHIDSWHYGAMDNGSANAVMLEIARIIGEEKPELYRSLKLAFWSGHSHGRYAGSALYADENWEDLHDHCVLHLNIDSVGGKNAVVLSEGNAMKETKQIAADAIKDITGEGFTSTRYGRAGDQSFWGPGVPSLLMGLSEQKPMDTPASAAFSKLFGGGKGGGFGWWWHTTEDTLDKISPAFLQRDCRIYLSIVLDVCMHPVLKIDQLEAVKELEGYVESYTENMPKLPVLQRTKERLQSLKDSIQKLEDGFQVLDEKSETQIRLYNQWNMEISRGLVRLNYVKENEFDHDPASPLAPLPLLQDASRYSEELPFRECKVIETTVIRNTNKVNFILRSLIHLSDEYHEKIIKE
ncbi:M28 family peptidase [Oceanobacillus alkalisoli]|uniref:M28 family peptidase n=1 Tax=Oceanobacillus alkalisoli TaxID=2925113 RepID=UPI001EE4D5D1|nr:M28 family peptidase [Oceanobacillus alkalisoli]MCG5105379.1 M28 family peptidase [Oceanobacillus alkalisoli]